MMFGLSAIPVSRASRTRIWSFWYSVSSFVGASTTCDSFRQRASRQRELPWNLRARGARNR